MGNPGVALMTLGIGGFALYYASWYIAKKKDGTIPDKNNTYTDPTTAPSLPNPGTPRGVPDYNYTAPTPAPVAPPPYGRNIYMQNLSIMVNDRQRQGFNDPMVPAIIRTYDTVEVVLWVYYKGTGGPVEVGMEAHRASSGPFGSRTPVGDIFGEIKQFKLDDSPDWKLTGFRLSSEWVGTDRDRYDLYLWIKNVTTDGDIMKGWANSAFVVQV